MTMTEKELILRLIEYIESSMWSMEQTCNQLRGDLKRLQEICDNVKTV